MQNIDKLKMLQDDTRANFEKFLNGDEAAGLRAVELLENMEELAEDMRFNMQARIAKIKPRRVANKIEEGEGILLNPERHYDEHPLQH